MAPYQARLIIRNFTQYVRGASLWIRGLITSAKRPPIPRRVLRISARLVMQDLPSGGAGTGGASEARTVGGSLVAFTGMADRLLRAYFCS